MKLGERIAFYRKQLNISQRELARRIGVTGQSISKIELGTGMPSMSMLTNIANELNVSLGELMENEEKVDKAEYDKLLEENQMLKQMIKLQQEKITELENKILSHD